MLRGAGYDVHYRGKWHLSKGEAGAFDATPEDLRAYGFDGWVAPDAGGDPSPSASAAAGPTTTPAYIEQAVAFLRERAGDADGRPFCLILSLVNPHDAARLPARSGRTTTRPADLEGDVGLPASADEDLAANLKPTAHAAMKPAHRRGRGPPGRPRAGAAVRQLLRQPDGAIDRQLAPVVDLLYADDGQPTPLGRQTVVVRFSDHGELGLAHGGLRQKAFNVYEETLRVPLIFSNPALAPEARSCPHPASLVNLVPTIAGLTGAEPPPGASAAPTCPRCSATRRRRRSQDEVLFTFDDMHAGTGQVAEILPGVPGRIRCIRERRFKYARYFNDDDGVAPEHEMYDLENDPLELENLAHPDHPRYGEPAVRAERERLAARLAAVEERVGRAAG